MRKNIKAAYFITADNRVLIFDINLKGFYDQVNGTIQNMPLGYDGLYSRFQRMEEFDLIIDSRTFHFQKIAFNE